MPQHPTGIQNIHIYIYIYIYILFMGPERYYNPQAIWQNEEIS